MYEVQSLYGCFRRADEVCAVLIHVSRAMPLAARGSCYPGTTRTSEDIAGAEVFTGVLAQPMC
jgi:hypothetical protein